MCTLSIRTEQVKLEYLESYIFDVVLLETHHENYTSDNNVASIIINQHLSHFIRRKKVDHSPVPGRSWSPE
jgi:hypothetical protein